MMLVFVMTAKYLIQINWLQKLALFSLTGPSQPLDSLTWIGFGLSMGPRPNYREL